MMLIRLSGMLMGMPWGPIKKSSLHGTKMLCSNTFKSCTISPVLSISYWIQRDCKFVEQSTHYSLQESNKKISISPLDQLEHVVRRSREYQQSIPSSRRSLTSLQAAEPGDAGTTQFAFNEILLSSAVYQRAAIYALSNTIGVDHEPSSSSVQVEGQHPVGSIDHLAMSTSSVMLRAPTPARYPTRDHHFGVPRDRGFYGREEVLDAVRKALHPQEHSIGISICTLYGLGGVGKTHIALEYAYRYSKQSVAYDIVWYINAQSTSSIAMSYSAIVNRLQLTTSAEPSVHVGVITEWLRHMGETTAFALVLLQLLTVPKSNLGCLCLTILIPKSHTCSDSSPSQRTDMVRFSSHHAGRQRTPGQLSKWLPSPPKRARIFFSAFSTGLTRPLLPKKN